MGHHAGISPAEIRTPQLQGWSLPAVAGQHARTVGQLAQEWWVNMGRNLQVDLIRFFELVLFNYLVANGDAHLKNFSLMETVQGDYILSPAYDLLCTALHVDDANLGLHGGLYDGDMAEKPYQNYGIYTYDSFRLFAGKIGIQEEIATGTIDRFMLNVLPAMNMIDRSFLSPESKVTYKEILGERHRRLMIR